MQRDIFNTPISVFTTTTAMRGGQLQVTSWRHYVRPIGRYLEAGAIYAEQIGRTRSTMTAALTAWDSGNVERYKELLTQYSLCKWRVPLCLPQGVNEAHNNDVSKFKSFSDVLCLDIDIEKPDKTPNGNEWINGNIDQVKRDLSDLPYVAYCAKSAGGRGLFALVPIASHEQHTEHWRAMQYLLKESFNLTIDAATANLGRLRFMSYDDNPIVNHSAEIFTTTMAEPQPQRQPMPRYVGIEAMSDTEERVLKCVDILEAEGIDITESHEEWKKASAAIAHTFGERGRGIFHRIAAQYPKYNERENNTIYTNLMKSAAREAKINSFFYLCQKYGVEIGQQKKYHKPIPLPDMSQWQVPELTTTMTAPPKPQPPTMSRVEANDLAAHQKHIEQGQKHLADMRAASVPFDELCRTLDLQFVGTDEWQMTDTQFENFYNTPTK